MLLLLLLLLLYYVVIIKRNDNDGKRASGIDVVEEGELDKGLQDIIELFNDNDKIRKEKNAAK